MVNPITPPEHGPGSLGLTVSRLKKLLRQRDRSALPKGRVSANYSIPSSSVAAKSETPISTTLLNDRERLLDLQKSAAQAIVNIFETGSALGEYGQVTILRGDTGHLTYGRAQTTLASGNLFILINTYVHALGARYAQELTTYLDRLADKDQNLDHDFQLHDVLRKAGSDPVMIETQNKFFDSVYWVPTLRSADYINVAKALSLAVVFDSRIHGSWHSVRDRTIEQVGKPDEIGEQEWISCYIRMRRDWLASHRNRLLRQTVYRMDAFQELIRMSNWTLNMPFHCRGILIDENILTGSPDARAHEMGLDQVDRQRPVLRIKNPFMSGPDVMDLQRALADQNLDVIDDGVYGSNTQRVVMEWQRMANLQSDGIVGPATWASLKLDNP